MLITDHLDREAWPDSRLYATYQDQHEIEGHGGFRWLKGPAKVAPMFLKLPERIEAMGLVFMLALMVRNYIEWTVRTHLRETGRTVPYYGGHHNTSTPTAEVVWNLFRAVQVNTARLGSHVRRDLSGLDEAAHLVLAAFNLSEADLRHPRRDGIHWLPGG